MHAAVSGVSAQSLLPAQQKHKNVLTRKKPLLVSVAPDYIVIVLHGREKRDEGNMTHKKE